MELIKNWNVTKLHMQEDFGFHQRVKTLATATLTNDLLKGVVSAYSSAVSELDAALLQDQTNSHTEAVQAADAQVDYLYTGMSYYLRGMERHPNAELAAAGKQAMAVVRKHGSLTGLNYTEQYGTLHNALQELGALTEEVLTALQLAEWLAALAQAVAQFTTARDAQAYEGSQHKTGLSKEKRYAADEAYRTLVNTVNALATALGDEDFATFIAQLNYYIADEEAKLKVRDTANAKKEEENKDESGTTETPENSETSEKPENAGN